MALDGIGAALLAEQSGSVIRSRVCCLAARAGKRCVQ